MTPVHTTRAALQPGNPPTPRPCETITVPRRTTQAMRPLVDIVAHARHVSGAGPAVPPPGATTDERDHPSADLLVPVATAQQAESHSVAAVHRRHLLLTGELGWALINGAALVWLIADLDGNQRCEVRRALTHRLCAVDHLLDTTTMTVRASDADSERVG